MTVVSAAVRCAAELAVSPRGDEAERARLLEVLSSLRAAG
jgi:hypothetical protein